LGDFQADSSVAAAAAASERECRNFILLFDPHIQQQTKADQSRPEAELAIA